MRIPQFPAKQMIIAIVLLLLIALAAMVIPVLYQNLNKPKIEIFQLPVRCDIHPPSHAYYFFVSNKGLATATNLEIEIVGTHGLVITMHSISNYTVVISEPFLNMNVPIDQAVITVPTLPPLAEFQFVVIHADNASAESANQPNAQKMSPSVMPFSIQKISFDQSSIEYSGSYNACIPITSTP